MKKIARVSFVLVFAALSLSACSTTNSQHSSASSAGSEKAKNSGIQWMPEQLPGMPGYLYVALGINRRGQYLVHIAPDGKVGLLSPKKERILNTEFSAIAPIREGEVIACGGRKCALYDVSVVSAPRVLRELPYHHVRPVHQTGNDGFKGDEIAAQIFSGRKAENGAEIFDLIVLGDKGGEKTRLSEITHFWVNTIGGNDRIEVQSAGDLTQIYSLDWTPRSPRIKGLAQIRGVPMQRTLDSPLAYQFLDPTSYEPKALPQGVLGFRPDLQSSTLWHQILATPQGPRLSAPTDNTTMALTPMSGVLDFLVTTVQTPDKKLASIRWEKSEEGLWRCVRLELERQTPYCGGLVSADENSRGKLAESFVRSEWERARVKECLSLGSSPDRVQCLTSKVGTAVAVRALLSQNSFEAIDYLEVASLLSPGSPERRELEVRATEQEKRAKEQRRQAQFAHNAELQSCIRDISLSDNQRLRCGAELGPHFYLMTLKWVTTASSALLADGIAMARVMNSGYLPDLIEKHRKRVQWEKEMAYWDERRAKEDKERRESNFFANLTFGMRHYEKALSQFCVQYPNDCRTETHSRWVTPTWRFQRDQGLERYKNFMQDYIKKNPN